MNIDQLVRDADPAALITIPDPPHVGAIMALGRARERRRRRHLGAGIAVGTAAAAAVLGLGLTGAFGAAPAHRTSTIHTTAFTLVKHANGTATLTINPGVLLEPSILQSDLEQDGIPAVVTTGSFCSSDPSPAGFSQVVTGQKPARTITINPAAMPAGTELSFGYFQLSPVQEAAMGLIDSNSYTCSSAVPVTPPSGSGAMLVYVTGPQNPAKLPVEPIPGKVVTRR